MRDSFGTPLLALQRAFRTRLSPKVTCLIQIEHCVRGGTCPELNEENEDGEEEVD